MSNPRCWAVYRRDEAKTLTRETLTDKTLTGKVHA
jgi:hypothetical protein